MLHIKYSITDSVKPARLIQNKKTAEIRHHQEWTCRFYAIAASRDQQQTGQKHESIFHVGYLFIRTVLLCGVKLRITSEGVKGNS